MRKLILFVAALAAAFAQQSRREVASPAGPADTKPNDQSVPDVYAVPTQFSRVLVLRFKYGTDLQAGLEAKVKEQGIRNAVILSAFGSVRNYHVHDVSNRTFPVKDTFVQDPTSPADIAGMSGFVMSGRVHAHITLASPDKAFAGHLEPGTNVFTFAVVTLGVLPDNLDLTRLDDRTWR